MKKTYKTMGMPVTIDIIDEKANRNVFDKIYSYFRYIDHKFSTYKKNSEITLINRKKITPESYSKDMKTILTLCEKTKIQTNGYFDIEYEGKIDPSGIVKGWAIFNANTLLKNMGFENYYIEAGGDIQVNGKNKNNGNWKIGIRNPFNKKGIIKVISVYNKGVATSGNYIRGNHIYNPKNTNAIIDDIVSLTVIGPNIFDADRFATAGFAMGKNGIDFIKNQNGFEGYMIDKKGIATFTNGFEKFCK